MKAVTTLMKDRGTGRLVSDYQLTHQTPPDANWMLQPTINTAPVGFLPSK